MFGPVIRYSTQSPTLAFANGLSSPASKAGGTRQISSVAAKTERIRRLQILEKTFETRRNRGGAGRLRPARCRAHGAFAWNLTSTCHVSPNVLTSPPVESLPWILPSASLKSLILMLPIELNPLFLRSA